MPISSISKSEGNNIMKTDVITVSSKGKQMETALQQVDKVAAYKGLSPKGALHLRLLAEEMMSMMRSITGEPEGEFWIEDNNGEYQLHLKAFFDWGCDEDYDGFAGPYMLPDAFEHSTSPALDWEWSMRRYEDVLSARVEQDSAAREAWDELEKSVVKNVADDVKVAISGGYVEMIILKKLA